tara:strand:- start:43 stop:1059 length:1017 start_codon:yes stop_codon:yes gene_type:complete
VKHTGTCAVIIDEEGTLCGDPIERPMGEHPYCKLHLSRAYRKGDTEGSRKKQRGAIEGLPTTCGVIDPDGKLCTNDSANPRGKHGSLCRKHARRQDLYGDVHGGNWQVKTCQLWLPDGTQCPKPHKGKVNGKGVPMCNTHWVRTRKWGDPRVDLPIDYHRGLRTCEVILQYDPKMGEQCNNLARENGLCSSHSERQKKYGDVKADEPIMPRGVIGDERFKYRMDPANGFIRLGDLYDGTPCHHWLGARNSRGYGCAGSSSENGYSRLAHRRAWQTFVGEIPHGFHVDHMCHQSDCVNVEHLRCLPVKDHVRATRLFCDQEAEIAALKKRIKELGDEAA